MELRLTPDYRLLTIRDVESDAQTDMREAIAAAATDVAASTGYVLVVSVAQDLIPVDVRVEFASPQPGLATDGALEFDIEFPTGQVLLRDMGVTGIVEDLPDGPGLYRARVAWSGRAASAQAAHAFLRDRSDLPVEAWPDELARDAGTERYTVWLWRVGDSPAQDEDEDEE
jgi:hypothetical protein